MQTSNIKTELSVLYKNSDINYRHDETTQAENEYNNYKQFKPQEIKWTRLALHTHTHACMYYVKDETFLSYTCMLTLLLLLTHSTMMHTHMMVL